MIRWSYCEVTDNIEKHMCIFKYIRDSKNSIIHVFYQVYLSGLSKGIYVCLHVSQYIWKRIGSHDTHKYAISKGGFGIDSNFLCDSSFLIIVRSINIFLNMIYELLVLLPTVLLVYQMYYYNINQNQKVFIVITQVMTKPCLASHITTTPVYDLLSPL